MKQPKISSNVYWRDDLRNKQELRAGFSFSFLCVSLLRICILVTSAAAQNPGIEIPDILLCMCAFVHLIGSLKPIDLGSDALAEPQAATASPFTSFTRLGNGLFASRAEPLVTFLARRQVGSEILSAAAIIRLSFNEPTESSPWHNWTAVFAGAFGVVGLVYMHMRASPAQSMGRLEVSGAIFLSSYIAFLSQGWLDLAMFLLIPSLVLAWDKF